MRPLRIQKSPQAEHVLRNNAGKTPKVMHRDGETSRKTPVHLCARFVYNIWSQTAKPSAGKAEPMCAIDYPRPYAQGGEKGETSVSLLVPTACSEGR